MNLALACLAQNALMDKADFKNSFEKALKGNQVGITPEGLVNKTTYLEN